MCIISNCSNNPSRKCLICIVHFFTSRHLSKPYIPDIPGFDIFQGYTVHSRQYRVPDTYRGQKVICVGGSFSGIDIMGDVAAVAEKVLTKFPNNT